MYLHYVRMYVSAEPEFYRLVGILAEHEGKA